MYYLGRDLRRENAAGCLVIRKRLATRSVEPPQGDAGQPPRPRKRAVDLGQTGAIIPQ